MAKIIQIFKDMETNHIVGLGDDGAVYEAIYLGEWIEIVPPLSRKKADKSVTLSGQASAKRFQPPAASDVAMFMVSKGLSESQAYDQATRFWHFYESNGWMVSKNKMKNWKSAATGWLSRNKPSSSIDNDSTDWYQDVERML